MAQNQEKFVDRFEKAMMQFVILNKAKEGGVTKDNLQQVFNSNIQMQGGHLEHCLNTLVQENHLKQEGNRYVITDDGREDVMQVQRILPQVSSFAGVGGQTGGQQTQGGMQSTTGAGGRTGTMGGQGGGNVGGGNVGGGQRR